jgi:3-dehydroquinate dehydratase-1
MTAAARVKGRTARAALVAVISTRSDLARASRLRRPPEFFELRLDCLWRHLPRVEASLPKLRAPLIATARHPREGGRNQLTAAQRRDLLLRFLPCAALVDVELRSAKELRPVLDAAAGLGVKCIISVHDFTAAPPWARMRQQAEAARALGADVFKIAVRTDTEPQLERLRAFFQEECAAGTMAISAMGIGKLGRASRLELAQRGSVLSYVHLGRTRVSGQLSLAEMRAALARPPRAQSRALS